MGGKTNKLCPWHATEANLDIDLQQGGIRWRHIAGEEDGLVRLSHGASSALQGGWPGVAQEGYHQNYITSRK